MVLVALMMSGSTGKDIGFPDSLSWWRCITALATYILEECMMVYSSVSMNGSGTTKKMIGFA